MGHPLGYTHIYIYIYIYIFIYLFIPIFVGQKDLDQELCMELLECNHIFKIEAPTLTHWTPLQVVSLAPT